MALNLDSLEVLAGNQGVIYDIDNPLKGVNVYKAETDIILFYQHGNKSTALTSGNHQLEGNDGMYYFLTAIPFEAATGSGSTYNLVVGKNLAKNGRNRVNCANLVLDFSSMGTQSVLPVVSKAMHNCSAIPDNATYLFQPFNIPGLDSSYDTLTIDVKTGPQGGVQNNVVVHIYGANNNSLLAVIDSNGDSYTFKPAVVGTIYLMAFIEPTPSQSDGKKEVTFETGDPETDSRVIFEDEVWVEEQVKPKNKGCLGMFFFG